MKKIIALLALSALAVANAQTLSFLVKEWTKDGNRFCEYDNGTVLNVGIKLCPLNIKTSP